MTWTVWAAIVIVILTVAANNNRRIILYPIRISDVRRHESGNKN